MRTRVGAVGVFVLLPVIAALTGQDVDVGRIAFRKPLCPLSRRRRQRRRNGPGNRLAAARASTISSSPTLIHEGLPARGMPPSDVAGAEMAVLLKFLRTIQRRPEAKPVVRRRRFRRLTGKTH